MCLVFKSNQRTDSQSETPCQCPTCPNRTLTEATSMSLLHSTTSEIHQVQCQLHPHHCMWPHCDKQPRAKRPTLHYQRHYQGLDYQKRREAPRSVKVPRDLRWFDSLAEKFSALEPVTSSPTIHNANKPWIQKNSRPATPVNLSGFFFRK
jgi:hypothetical protein